MGFSSDLGMTKQVHLIGDGRVFCRRDGRYVDFERCLVCPLLRDIDLDSRHPKVVCQLPAEVEDRLLAAV
ncbi:MAG TPA: hypothetical protein VI056_11940 [Candidatus Limnocylindria bacterium]